MKKKLLLSSILTPIIPITALVSCGNGVIVLDQTLADPWVCAYSSNCKLPYPTKTHTMYDLNLSLDFSILPSDCTPENVTYISLRQIVFSHESLIGDVAFYFYDDTSTINEVMFNDEELPRGDKHSTNDCWYLGEHSTVEGEVYNLIIHLNNWDSKSKLSLSLSIDKWLYEENYKKNIVITHFTPAICFEDQN